VERDKITTLPKRETNETRTMKRRRRRGEGREEEREGRAIDPE
jgi:hypothetical protein